MTFSELAEFKRDLKNLLKKYRTLNEDLEVVKAILKRSRKNDHHLAFVSITWVWKRVSSG